MIRLERQWLNPDHVVQIVPGERVGCAVYLLAGPPVYLLRLTADEVAELILRAQGAGQ